MGPVAWEPRPVRCAGFGHNDRAADDRVSRGERRPAQRPPRVRRRRERGPVARCARRRPLCRRDSFARGRARRPARAAACRRARPSTVWVGRRSWTRHRRGHRRIDRAARSLEHVERGPSKAELDRVLADGPAVGIATVAVVDAARGGGTVLARFAQRWVFHLDDPSDAPTLGVPSARVPAAIPGRLVVAASGLEAQVAIARTRSARGRRWTGAGRGAAAMLFRPAALGRPGAHRTVVGLPIGLDFTTLSTAVLHLPIGDHVVRRGTGTFGSELGADQVDRGLACAASRGACRVICPSPAHRWSSGTASPPSSMALRSAGADRRRRLRTVRRCRWPAGQPPRPGRRCDERVRRRSSRLDARRLRPLDGGVPRSRLGS